MMFLFAYLGSLGHPPGWPVRLIYATETGFVVATLFCVFQAASLRKGGAQIQRDLVAAVGGVCAAFGLIMPLELAPVFFNVSGEIMLATVALILVYPIAAFLFIMLFRKFVNVAPSPPPLPR
jgi:hypothetical protein